MICKKCKLDLSIRMTGKRLETYFNNRYNCPDCGVKL